MQRLPGASVQHAYRWATACVLVGSMFLSTSARVLAVESVPTNVTVTMGDTGFQPVAVTIVSGGNVTWVNKGARVHTATSIGGAPLGFDTGGLGAGQKTSRGFGLAGDYYYTSATDCLANGGGSPAFPCTISYLVTVVPQAGAAPVPGTGSEVPSTVTVPVGPPRNATVTITDSGMSPPAVTIPLTGTVSWINQGSEVHTATGGSADSPFDTGGLSPGQGASITFADPGTYTYTSATDCVSRSNTPGFGCEPYTVVVTTAPPQERTMPTSTAAPRYSWLSKNINDPPLNCGAAQKLLGWLPPHQTPCTDSAPNSGTQYVQGHVMDQSGRGIGGMIVRASIYGNNYDATSDQDGTFSIVLSVDCPIENRVYSVFIVDGQGRQSSDVRSVSYSNCNVAGEFHFDFVEQG